MEREHTITIRSKRNHRFAVKLDLVSETEDPNRVLRDFLALDNTELVNAWNESTPYGEHVTSTADLAVMVTPGRYTARFAV